MRCLRIYISEVETGRSLRKIRVPLAIIRIAAQLLPPRAFELYGSDIDGVVGKEIANSVYKMLLAVSEDNDSEIKNGLIVEMEEFNEESKSVEYTVVFVE